MKSIVSTLLLAFIWANCIYAQDIALVGLDPTKELSQYVHDVWTVEDGLPSSTILDIAQDRAGYLWIATDNGLSRFDGERFVNFDASNTETFTSSYIRDLHLARDESLWIATSGGLLRYADGEFELFTQEDGLVSDHVRALAEDSSGGLWIGTVDGNLHRLENGAITVIRLPPDIAPRTIGAISVDASGGVWLVGPPEGLYRYRGGRFSAVVSRAGGDREITSVLVGRSGEVWAGGLKLYKVDEEGVSAVEIERPAGLRVGITALHEDRHGTMWVGIGGLNRIVNGRVERITFTDNPSTERPRAILDDREGNLWFGGTDSGLFRLKAGRISQYSVFGAPDGTEYPYFAVHRSRDGILRAGCQSGLLRYENGVFKIEVPNDGKPLGPVWSIAEDRNGTLWLGSETGLIRYAGGNVELETASGLPAGGVSSVFVDQDDRLWLHIVGVGLGRLEDGVFDTMTNLYIRHIYQDRAGTLYFGCRGGGLYYLRDRSVVRFPDPDGLFDFAIPFIHEDKDGDLWIGARGNGLVRRKTDGSFRVYRKQDGLCSDIISWMLEGGGGSFWVSSEHGIYRVERKHFDDFDTGRLATIPCRNYGTEDGLKTLEARTGLPAGATTADGRLWFTLFSGIAAVGPEEIVNPLPPTVVIEEVLADGERVRRDALDGIPPGRRDVEIHYTAPSLRAPEKVRFQYQLEGFDDDLTEAGDRRVAYYTSIPQGSYRFRVRAANDSGVWNEQGATTSLTFLPYFYETWWFRLLSGLFLAALLYAAYRARTKKIQARNRELEGLVHEREQAELELRSALSQIKKLQENLEQENVYLREEVQKTHSDFHEIIGESDGLKKVIHRVQQVAATDTTVLILGETGTGKELIAQAIHRCSLRKARPLITINPSALPSTLIESELFGHEKGAFTGAIQRGMGRFEMAHGGTLFLDEIGELDPSLQTKLLRVLQEGELQRVGGTETLKVDVRVLAATNEDLDEATREGRFRSDLFYRLNVFPIEIPPLRERREDIPFLVWHFVNRHGTALRKTIDQIPQSLMEAFVQYGWPGNVRELENLIERAVILSPGPLLQIDESIGVGTLGMVSPGADPTPLQVSAGSAQKPRTLEEAERAHIVSVLESCGWKVSGKGGAAEVLGVPESTLRNQMKRLGIERRRRRTARHDSKT